MGRHLVPNKFVADSHDRREHHLHCLRLQHRKRLRVRGIAFCVSDFGFRNSGLWVRVSFSRVLGFGFGGEGVWACVLSCLLLLQWRVVSSSLLLSSLELSDTQSEG